MNITFLYHSSFLVELSGCTLLFFDWYGGPVPDYDRSKPLYVFASHHHGDHYAPEIFAQLGMDNVWYVLANCIRLSAKRKAALGIDDSHVFRLAAGLHLPWGAGHTNLPLHRCLERGLSGRGRRKNHLPRRGPALVALGGGGRGLEPGDGTGLQERVRQAPGETGGRGLLRPGPPARGEFWWGFDWWMRTMEVKHAFPMHSWEDYTLVQTLRTLPCSAPYRDRVVEVSGKGQVFSWED